MNRKRHDFEYNGHENGELGPVTKRIKSPLLTVDQLSLSNDRNARELLNVKQSEHTKDIGKKDQNGLSKLAMIFDVPSEELSKGCHNRKRRPRLPQDIYVMNGSTDSSVCYAPASGNGQTRKKSDLSCVVCCGLAHGYNFDAISCESCKAFFRRNALFNVERLKCRRDGACEITLETRRRCKSCRLKKCFAVGMRKEWILTEEEKINKKRRIEENRRLRVTSTTESSSPPATSNSDGKVRLDLQSVVLHTNKTSTVNSMVFRQNKDVVNNVDTAFNDGFQLDPTSYGWSYPLAKKITALCQILNTKNTTALRLISFYRRLSEFDSLNEIDKVNLIKNNLPYIFLFHGSLGYDPVKDVYHEGIPSHDCLVYGADIQEAHGDDIHSRCTSIMRSLQSIVQIDRRIIHLALVVMLFSKGLSCTVNFREPRLNNYQQVFQAQNFYIEQLWLHMETHYGPARTALTFSKLTSNCLLIQGLLSDIQQNIHDKIDPYQIPPVIRTIMQLS